MICVKVKSEIEKSIKIRQQKKTINEIEIKEGNWIIEKKSCDEEAKYYLAHTSNQTESAHRTQK